VCALRGKKRDVLVWRAGSFQLGDHVPEYARDRSAARRVVDKDEHTIRWARQVAKHRRANRIGHRTGKNELLLHSRHGPRRERAEQV
jgi:hypothetical protein